MDRGAWRVTVHRVAQSDTMEATKYVYFNGSQNTSKVNVFKQ